MEPVSLIHIMYYITKNLKLEGIEIVKDFVEEQEMGLGTELVMIVVVKLK
jgi:hypothetical protein